MTLRNVCKTVTRIIMALSAVVPATADTLAEAVQQGLISHPDVLLSSSVTLPSPPKNDAWHSSSTFTPAADLALNSAVARLNELKRQDIADDLAIGIVDRYLDVLRCDKLLASAQVNFRLHRSVFITLSQQKDNSAAHQAELRHIRARLALAESMQMRAETRRHQAKKTYAQVVGRWPASLEWPQGPGSNELPASVGQAIEQGLDNYSLPAPQQLKRRSMVALSDAIRQSWNDWTHAGLQLNPLQKQVAELEQQRNQLKDEFRQGKTNAQTLLDTQYQLYQAEKSYTKAMSQELSARYQILNSIGRLMPFVSKEEIQEDNPVVTTELASSAEQALLQMTEGDRTAYPYPSYKPQFQDEMDVSALSMPRLNAAVVNNGVAWYVSAGQFKNKANALALTNRLKSLGFIVSLDSQPTQAEVLIGPYEFRGHAVQGLKRLKETAHVQGVLVTSRQKTSLG